MSKHNTTTALTPMEKRELVLTRAVEKQKALFMEVNGRAQEKGRPAPYPDVDAAIIWNRIEKTPTGGFKVMKRVKPLDIYSFDLESQTNVNTNLDVSYGRRMGVAAMTPDETKLRSSRRMRLHLTKGTER